MSKRDVSQPCPPGVYRSLVLWWWRPNRIIFLACSLHILIWWSGSGSNFSCHFSLTIAYCSLCLSLLSSVWSLYGLSPNYRFPDSIPCSQTNLLTIGPGQFFKIQLISCWSGPLFECSVHFPGDVILLSRGSLILHGLGELSSSVPAPFSFHNQGPIFLCERYPLVMFESNLLMSWSGSPGVGEFINKKSNPDILKYLELGWRRIPRCKKISFSRYLRE
jgi:hypothetical protein